MRIPTAAGERYALYDKLTQACLCSQMARRAQYDRWKRYYMMGCNDGENPNTVVNKIYPHIDQLTSFMYAQDTTRFAVELGASASGLYLGGATAMADLVNENWHNSDTDINFGMALTWAWVYGTMLVKPVWRQDGIQCGIVEPHNFGVLREDSPKLSSQEAFVHEYLISKTQLQDELEAAITLGAISREKVDQILNSVVAAGHPSDGETGGPANIVITTIQPLIAGNMMQGGISPTIYSTADYRPRVAEPLVKMQELYVWNSEQATYQVVTQAEGGNVIWDRPLSGKMGIKGEPPFIQICPNPAADYFWGHSELERLVPLQDMRNERLRQVRRMMELQANPPSDFAGYTVTDEIMAAFNAPGGKISSDMPGAKVTEHSPPIPEDLFRELNAIDSMFEEMSGVNNVMSGRGEAGVRSAGHASQLARLGSSRAKKRAMIIEDALENMATYYGKVIQKYCAKRLRTEPIEDGEAGLEFIPEQFTDDYIVKVDAHSNSPIFMEDQRELVFALLKANMIDRESALDLLDVGGKQLLKMKLRRKILPTEAKQAAQKAQLAAIQGGKAKGGKK
jgi:hypothetical protein